jgi:anti-sigma regulatory factor (Ser/Thr protein kinase)
MRALKAALDGEAEHVQFAEMEKIGRNPACIIPAWQDFLDEHGGAGRPLRGIGEPIWAERTAAELVECHQHESLLNLAFADTPAFRLACPYDTEALAPEVVERAKRNHPFIARADVSTRSAAYVPPEFGAGPFDAELPEPASEPEELPFGWNDVRVVRWFVSKHAEGAGIDPDRVSDLALAVGELATNTLMYAGGTGTVRVWNEDGALVCEVADDGRFVDPLLGRRRASPDELGGRGLWLVNHLCDLVQMRSYASGTVVRVRLAIR